MTDTTLRPVRRWLVACIVAVILAVVVGGITRLTESGLSITEWRPVSGVLPPRSAEAWDAAFAAFQQIPQASTTHAGMTLREFKWIFWWEWFHRILARGVGLVFAVPFVVLLARGAIPTRLRWRAATLPVLTGAQGALGWYMVQSGLSERITVSAYRLTAHLALALAILVIAVWTYADVRSERAGLWRTPEPQAPVAPRWRMVMLMLTAALATTILSGGAVAGLRAGTIFNTFPLMGGELIPTGYALVSGWWANAFENPVAAQFHHRILAILTGLAALMIAWQAYRSSLPPAITRAIVMVGAIVLVQVSLGVLTLLLAVPIVLGVLHQLVGVLALSAAVVAVHRATYG